MTFIKHRISLLLVATIVAASIGFFQVKQAKATVWRTAYQVAFTHYDPWYEPHYGAWFSGAYGSNYYFSGYSGAPPNPNWWGNRYQVALLSKTWLFALACPVGWPPQVSTCPDRWAGLSHHSLMQY